MKIQVYRTSTSSYQNSKFLTKEKTVLEEIPGVKYIQSLNEIDSDIPFILITNTHTNPEEIAPNILENTKLLIHPNSGHDNISLEFLKKSDFPIILGNPIRANAVAEYTLGCIFKEYTPVPYHHHWSSDRTWDRKLLRDQKVTILGYGHIGKLLKATLSPLCKEVKVFDPNIEGEVDVISTTEGLYEKTDILIVAANLNPSSLKMVDNKVFQKLNNNCLIINPARGEIINEEHLIQYLQKNPEAKCYLDVFEFEPFKPGYLNEIKNINKTSHIAGVYDKLNKDIISFEYIVIKDFVESMEGLTLNNFHGEYNDCLLTEDLYQ
jgi:D-3-phosphoglycerate dehydrogenase